MDKVSKSTYIIAAFAFIIIVAAIYFLFIFQKKPATPKEDNSAADIKQATDVPVENRPFIALVPTTDGVSINLRASNMSYFDKIDYELTYQADNPQLPGQKIARGSTGSITDTKSASHEDQMLLGTGSKGVRTPDTGITDGKLTLHMFKGQTEFRSETSWNLVKASSTEILETQDGNFKLTPTFATSYWMIAADTVGLPPQDNNQNKFDSKNITLPVYGAFSVTPAFTKPAKISITLSKDTQNPTLYLYNLAEKSWTKLDSTYDSATKTISSQTSAFGAFTVVSSK